MTQTPTMPQADPASMVQSAEPCAAFQATLVDAMERVYPDLFPDENAPSVATLDAAPGQCVAVVVAARAPSPGLLGVSLQGWRRLDAPPEKDAPEDAPLATRINWLKPVHVEGNSVTICKPSPWREEKGKYLLRPAPFDVCEALWPASRVPSPGQRTEAFVVRFDIPSSTPAGRWRYTLAVDGPGGQPITLQGDVEIHPVTLPARPILQLLNWTRVDRLLWQYPHIQPWSDEHWKLVETTLKLLLEAGQNVAYLTLAENGGNLVDAWLGDDGRYHFDFSRFDRKAEMALAMGYTRLAGSHVGSKKKLPGMIECDPYDPLIHIRIPGKGGYDPGPQISAESPEALAYLKAFFTALQDHLASRGWLDIYIQAVSDEPFRAVAESYCRTAQYVRQVAPRITLHDAASSHAAAHALDIPVPEIDYLEIHQDFYRSLGEKGKACWLYTCCCPVDHWPNRFLDFHLNKGLLLPWFCFHYGVGGFLHWGAVQWPKQASPFEKSGFQGDGFILYPGPDGPVGSMRLLAQQLGQQDHQMLATLAGLSGDGQAQARAICRSIIRSPMDYEHDCQAVNHARRRLLLALAQRGK